MNAIGRRNASRIGGDSTRFIEVVWNDIEGSTMNLKQKNIDFVKASNSGASLERADKLKNCIYGYYKSNINATLTYLRTKFSGLTAEEISQICHQCCSLKLFQVEIDDVVACHVMQFGEDYCVNWMRKNNFYSSSKDLTNENYLRSLLGILEHENNVKIRRCTVFFDDVTNTLHSLSTSSSSGSSSFSGSPFSTIASQWKIEVTKVTEGILAMNLCWRNYYYVIRRIHDLLCLIEEKAAEVEEEVFRSSSELVQAILDRKRFYFDHSFVISLLRRTDRRDRLDKLIKKNLCPFPFTIFDAVDPVENVSDALKYDAYCGEYLDRNLSPQDMLNDLFHFHGYISSPSRFHCRMLNEGEYGVYMSYVHLIRQSIDRNDPYLCVLEDDVCFHKNFSRLWEGVCTLLPDCNVLFLGAKSYHPILETTCGFHHLNEYTTGAHSVLFRRDALLLLEPFLTTQPYLPIDEMLKFACMKFANEKLKPFVVEPALVITLCGQDTSSDIQPSTKHNSDTYESFNWTVENYHMEI